MRIDLSSLMTLAHAFKRDRLISMADAMKMAWLKAHDWSHVGIVTYTNAQHNGLTRVIIPTYDAVDAHKACNEWVRAHAQDHRDFKLRILGYETAALRTYERLPMRKLYA